MTDLPTWSINLGRWSGVQIRIHLFLILYAVSRLINAAVAEGHPVGATAAWLALLLVALIFHELGHAVVASVQNVEVEDIRLWPLGNLVMPGPAKAGEGLAVASAGLATSGALAIASAIFLRFAGASMIFSPFGSGPDPGAPTDHAGLAIPAFHGLWWIGWFGHLNWVLFLANVIPALPLDGGRIFRRYLARNSVGLTRDNPYAQWTARAMAGILTLVGLVRIVSGSLDSGVLLLSLAFLIEMIVRTETKMLEDGGFYEDGVFGYDFSEGYTSLEAGAAKVRPYKESAIKRWRRKRSDFRRQRRIAREAAEERRMDEILEKLYLQGKGALTDEEHRFLVRVSAKIRNNRPRAR